MALTQRLELRHSQALVMTPQLMQAIKLLQLSNLDLAAYVEGELERNPLLERATEAGETPDPAEDGRDAAAAGAEQPGAGTDIGQDIGQDIGHDLETSRSAMEERLGTDLDNVFPDDASAASPRPANQPVG